MIKIFDLSQYIRNSFAFLFDNRPCKNNIWFLTVLLSPLALLVSVLCCLGFGMAEHNNAMMDYCFYGASYAGEIPAEVEPQMAAMRSAFSSLDSAVTSINSMAESDGLDSIQVKAAFYVLCGDGQMSPEAFVNCFYTTEQRTRMVTVTNGAGEEVITTETYTVTIPKSPVSVYSSLDSALGREVTPEEKANIQEIYTRIAENRCEGGDSAHLWENALA